MTTPWLRPLSELDRLEWASFELRRLEGNERIPCKEIPDLLRKLAAGQTYTGPLGYQLATDLLDFYEYTMQFQFTPVMNEVLPFLIGLLHEPQPPKVIAQILRFLAWAFTAADLSTKDVYVLEAFNLEPQADWDEEDSPDSETMAEVQAVLSAARSFLTMLPGVLAEVRSFSASEDFSVRGAATRLLFAAGVLQGKSSAELTQILTERAETDTMLNLAELEHFQFNLDPADRQRHAVRVCAQEIFDHSESLAVRWQTVMELGTGEAYARNPVLEEVIARPELVERQFRMVAEVKASEMQGAADLDEFLEMAVLPTQKEVGRGAVPMAIRFFSARMQSVLTVEESLRVMLALIHDFQRCQEADGSSYSVMYGPEILRRLRVIPAELIFERTELLEELDRCLERNDEDFALLNPGEWRHLLLYWLALKLRSEALFEATAALDVAG